MKKNIKKIVIIVLIIIVSLLIIIKILSSLGTSNMNKTPDNNKEPNENIIDTNWMEYMTESNIKEISITRTTKTNDKKINEKKITIPKENLTEIISKLSKYNLVKEYGVEVGFTEGEMITIYYEKEAEVYNLSLANGYIFIETIGDLELLNSFENTAYIIEKEELKGKEKISYAFKYDYDNSIFDSYFE